MNSIYMSQYQAEVKRLQEMNDEVTKRTCIGSDRRPAFDLPDAMDVLDREFTRWQLVKTKNGRFLLDAHYEDDNGMMELVGTNEERSIMAAICAATLFKYTKKRG